MKHVPFEAKHTCVCVCVFYVTCTYNIMTPARDPKQQGLKSSSGLGHLGRYLGEASGGDIWERHLWESYLGGIWERHLCGATVPTAPLTPYNTARTPTAGSCLGNQLYKNSINFNLCTRILLTLSELLTPMEHALF